MPIPPTRTLATLSHPWSASHCDLREETSERLPCATRDHPGGLFQGGMEGNVRSDLSALLLPYTTQVSLRGQRGCKMLENVSYL